MTPPNVIFIPDGGGGFTLQISGAIDSSTASVSVDTNPSASPTTPTGLSSVQIRSDSFGVGILFSGSVQRDSFVSTYSSGTWTLIINGDTGVTSTGWSYDTTVASNRAYIRSSDWASYPSNFPYGIGDLYTLTLA